MLHSITSDDESSSDSNSLNQSHAYRSDRDDNLTGTSPELAVTLDSISPGISTISSMTYERQLFFPCHQRLSLGIDSHGDDNLDSYTPIGDDLELFEYNERYSESTYLYQIKEDTAPIYCFPNIKGVYEVVPNIELEIEMAKLKEKLSIDSYCREYYLKGVKENKVRRKYNTQYNSMLSSYDHFRKQYRNYQMNFQRNVDSNETNAQTIFNMSPSLNPSFIPGDIRSKQYNYLSTFRSLLPSEFKGRNWNNRGYKVHDILLNHLIDAYHQLVFNSSSDSSENPTWLYGLPTETIGKGGFGTVVKWDNMSTGKSYCVKHVTRDIRYDHFKDDLISVLEEFVILYDLRHNPNVINGIDVFASPMFKDQFIIIEEYFEGDTLEVAVKKNVNFELPQYCDFIFKKLVWTITELHEYEEVCHNDLKPDNILINSTNEIKVIDFGLSFNLNTPKNQVIERKTLRSGSLSNLPPEAFNNDINSFKSDRNFERIGKSKDVFAIGVIYFNMISKGQKLWEKANILDDYYYRKFATFGEIPLLEEIFINWNLIFQFPKYQIKYRNEILRKMLNFDNLHRCSVNDINSSDWFKTIPISIFDHDKIPSEFETTRYIEDNLNFYQKIHRYNVSKLTRIREIKDMMKHRQAHYKKTTESKESSFNDVLGQDED